MKSKIQIKEQQLNLLKCQIGSAKNAMNTMSMNFKSATLAAQKDLKKNLLLSYKSNRCNMINNSNNLLKLKNNTKLRNTT